MSYHSRRIRLRLRQLWRLIAEPTPLTVRERHRNTRILLSLLAVSLGMEFGAILLMTFAPERFKLAIVAVLCIALLFIGGAYHLGRRGQYTLAAEIMVATYLIGTYGSLAFVQNGSFALGFLCLGVLISGLFLSSRETLFTLLVSVIAVFFLPAFNPGVSNLQAGVGVFFILSIAAFAFAATAIQRQDLEATERRSRELMLELAAGKHAEQALREAEENYRSFFENAAGGIYQSSPQGRFTRANSSMARILGYASPDEVVTSIRSIRDQFYADPGRRTTAMQLLAEKGTLENFESECFRKDGSRIWVSENARAVKDADGTLLYYQGFIQDITERKRVEDALRESEEKYRNLFNNAEVGMFRSRLDGSQVIEVNRKFLDIVGMTLEEALANPSVGLWADRKERGEMVKRLVADGSVSAFECRLLNKRQGDVRNCLASQRLYREEGILEGSILDITERKRAEEALRESQARFSTVFQSSPVAISLCTLAEGRCIDVNEAYLRLWGSSRDEVINRFTLEMGVWNTPAERQQFLDRLARKRYIKNLELGFVTKSGLTRYVLASYEVIQLGGENCILALFQDITERKQAEEALAQSHEQLRVLSIYWQNAIEAQRAHIAREIHDEFGQSMSALKMDLSWLTNRLPEGDERVDRVRTMTALVDDSIALMRRIATELRPGLLDDLGLNAALEWQAREFTRRSEIPCSLKLPDDDLALDPALNTTLFRIFQETLTNVLRHAQATRVDASFQQEGGILILTVQDNGRGITESELNDPRSLGLMGLRERAAQWGGHLTIHGTAGHGTTVTVRVPLPASPVNGGK